MLEAMPNTIKRNGRILWLVLCPSCKKPDYKKETRIDRDRAARDSRIDDRPVYYSKTKCRSCAMKGKRNRGPGDTLKVGWSFVKPNGVEMVRQENGSWMSRHRMVMERVLGRKLVRGELVRFRDGDPKNLDPANLYVVLRTFGQRATPSGGCATP